MFIELVDALRCPNPHEEIWLVLASGKMEGRDVMEGVLGCPICHAEYPIEAGVAWFDGGANSRSRGAVPDEEEALRLAALLDLTDSRGYAILVGDAGSQAPRLRALTDVQLLLVNPPSGIEMGNGLSGLTTPMQSLLPLAALSARAIALDNAASAELLESALNVVCPGGRILAPAGLSIPSGVIELARDERQWVGERARASVSSGIVTIHRRQ